MEKKLILVDRKIKLCGIISTALLYYYFFSEKIAGTLLDYLPKFNFKLTIMQDKPGEMTTITSVLEKLRIKKQDNEFKLEGENFTTGNGKFYKPEDLKITKTYRFEGESDPSDNTVIYLIEAKDGLTGYSMDAYGVYSDHDDEAYDDFIRKIPVEGREDQIVQ